LTEVYTSGGVCGLIRQYAKILPSLKRCMAVISSWCKSFGLVQKRTKPFLNIWSLKKYIIRMMSSRHGLYS